MAKKKTKKKIAAKKKKVVKKVAKKVAVKAKTAKKPSAKKVKAKKAAPKAKASKPKSPKASPKTKVAKKKPSTQVSKKVQGRVKKAATVAPSTEVKGKKAAKTRAEVSTEKLVDLVVDVEAPIEEDFEEEVVLTDAEGNRICRVPDCDQLAQVESYCRYHYLLFWKKIQIRKKILSEGKLERYIEELTARYPDKFLEVLKKDLRSPKDFVSAIHELELDESNDDGDYEDEAQNYIEEIRGVSDTSTSRDEDEY